MDDRIYRSRLTSEQQAGAVAELDLEEHEEISVGFLVAEFRRLAILELDGTCSAGFLVAEFRRLVIVEFIGAVSSTTEARVEPGNFCRLGGNLIRLRVDLGGEAGDDDELELDEERELGRIREANELSIKVVCGASEDDDDDALTKTLDFVESRCEPKIELQIGVACRSRKRKKYYNRHLYKLYLLQQYGKHVLSCLVGNAEA